VNNKKKKRKAERFTIILIPNSGAEAKKLSLSHKQIKGAVCTVALMSCLLLFAVLHIYHSRHILSEAKDINARHAEQTRQVTELNRKLLEMEQQKDRIEDQQEQIRKLVGAPSSAASTSDQNPSRGSMGGVSRSAAPGSLPELAASTASLQLLMDEQEREAQELLDFASGRIDQIKAIPNRWPVLGEITSTFGWRGSPFSRSKRNQEFHNGIDIAAPYGTPVHAAADGVVISAGWVSGWGRLVKISHSGGIVTSYAHNSSIQVKTGDKVAKGDIIAKVGSSGRSTGSHCHFTVEKNGQAVDPMIYLP
jgi:murein DD-endopeptidase MepM/ murein hydrolase activator NlpD